MAKNMVALALALSLAPLGLAEAPKPADAAQKAEIAKLRRLLEAEQAKNVLLNKEINALRDRSVKAEVEAAALKNRALQLAKQVATLTREIARLRAKVAPAAGAKNRPPDDVEGLVKQVDGKSGLITITVGSDAGLARGHTLEVYRLKPMAKYLGTIEIVDVTRTQAVAKTRGRMLGPIQVGDQVASRIKP
jgi:hypothetical protein